MSLSVAFANMRKRHGVDTLQMAKGLNCSVRNVQTHMQNGCDPKFSTIRLLCAEIGCTVADLIDEYNKVMEASK